MLPLHPPNPAHIPGAAGKIPHSLHPPLQPRHSTSPATGRMDGKEGWERQMAETESEVTSPAKNRLEIQYI